MPDGFPFDQTAPPELRARLARLMAHYDIVQGWTLSAQLAAQAGHRRYIACELGTLRGLPWQDSPEGRLAAWLYRAAPEVFVTNSDCLPLAAQLGVAPERTTAILHPYDLRSIPQDPAPPPPPGPDGPVLLAPARHHWTSGSGAWLKGNDVYLRALGQLAAQGRRFQLVTVRWGAEVAQSQALIDQLGFADRVTWVEPAPRMAMWRAYAGAAAVLDQFAAETFGGAGLDTMAAARRLITRFDPATALPFFQRQPPLTAVTGVEETAAAIAGVLDDPQDQAGGGRALRDWLQEEFQLDRQLGPQLAAYARLLRNDPA
jgi:glycosyltransferase involved in cell wall biosynthesis